MLQLIANSEQHDRKRVPLIGFFQPRPLAAGSLTSIAREYERNIPRNAGPDPYQHGLEYWRSGSTGRCLGNQGTRGPKRARIPIPQLIRPYIEAWRKVCPNTSPDPLMFPTLGHLKNKGIAVPFRAKNFFKWKVRPVNDRLGIPRNLCTFQVFRRTLGTDLQKHGAMKDAQAIMRQKHIKTTAEVYMDHIPDSVRKAIDARTEAIFELGSKKRPRKSSGV